MRRLLATLIGLFLISSSVAQQPVTRPNTQPSTTTAPTTTASTQASTQPTTQQRVAASRAARDEKRKEDAKRQELINRVSGMLSTLPLDAETTLSDVNSISTKAAADDVTATIDNSLPGLLSEINPRLAENDRLLTPSPTLETLRSLEGQWSEDARQLDSWIADLTRRKTFLDANIGKLNARTDEWRAKRRAVADAVAQQGEDKAFDPNDIEQINQRIRTVRDRTRPVLDLLNWEWNRANSLIITMSAAQVRVRDALGAVREAQNKARDKLLAQDSPPLWSALQQSATEENVAEQGRNTLSNQWQVLRNYVARQQRYYLFHLAGVMALAAVLIWLRRQTRQWIGSDPNLQAATRVFQTPIATAITVSMILTPWIYLAAPRLFWGIVGTAALIPTIWVLRPLIERSLRPLLYGLAGATFMNLLISIAAALPLISRLLFLVEMGGAAIFFVWFLRTGRGEPGDPNRPPLRKAAIIGARFGLAVTLFAFGANVFGFVSLSRLVGSALLTSAYLGVLLDTSVHVVDALLLGASHIKPLSNLGMIQRHRPLLLGRLHVLMSVLAVLLWGFLTLDALTIRLSVVNQAKVIWAWPKEVDEVFPAAPVKQTTAINRAQAAEDAEANATTQSAEADARPSAEATQKEADAKIAAARADADAAKAQIDAKAASEDANGTKAITSSLYFGGVISFILTLMAAYYASRFIAFLLDEDVYPRLHLARGIPYAITTLLRYAVLAIGFTLAIASLGYDTKNLTILASAFSIGLGFGLQNIVNNFVSGLILLFERPVQVGDVIELDNVTGIVSRIGIRASVIRTPLAAEIIIPNGRLISDRVVNWTLSNRQRGIELPVTIAAGPEPQQVIKLLVSAAKQHPLVATYPAPQAYFTDFAGGGLKFEVRAWTNRFEDWATVRSEVAMAINATLLKENIQLK